MKADAAALSANLRAVQERIARACDRAGRSPSEVTLLPVTKSVGPAVVRALFDLGVRGCGENRVLDAIEKAAACPAGIEWHMVGHLQTNKARKAVGLFQVFHSIDSLRLAELLSAEAARIHRTLDVYLEVNVSAEASKGGLRPEEAPAGARAAAALPSLRLCGLMTMAPLVGEPERVRPVFRRLRELRDRIASEGFALAGLSMGMSQDFGVAIEEGATVVRVGTALFKGVER